MSLGEKLKTLRVRAGKTLKEQSEIFNVSMNSVYRWEHDLAVPRHQLLKSIAKFYNVDTAWFFQEDDDTGTSGQTQQPNASEIEQRLLNAFRKLTDSNKYIVVGYVERMLIEQ